MHGIVLVNKPVGITSFDVVREARKIFKTKKIGHTGTLDPFAEGLLVLCVGKATKLVETITNADKTYTGTIVFGKHFDTYDVTGEVLRQDDKIVGYNNILDIKDSFIGQYMQMPPIYSAIKKDGKKLYEYARENKDVEIDKRLVEIFMLEFDNNEKVNEFTFETHVSKGTYIRSLAVDIAERLDTYAALKTLKRTKIGMVRIFLMKLSVL